MCVPKQSSHWLSYSPLSSAMVEFLVVSIFFNLRYYSEFEDIEPDGDNDEDWHVTPPSA